MTARFPESKPAGREQAGDRPAIVVGVPDFIEAPRYPGLILVPLTSQVQHYLGRSSVLYPRFPTRVGGLTRDSVALTDQVRFLDHRRLTGYLGHLTREEYAPVQRALALMHGASLNP